MKEIFGPGPYYVENRTNTFSEIFNAEKKRVASFGWSSKAAERAYVLCNLLNGENVGSQSELRNLPSQSVSG